jgi:hypothetical protein
MKGLAHMERRVARLERDLGDDEDLLAELNAMTDDELRAYFAELKAAPSYRSATEWRVGRLLAMSDLELQEHLRRHQEARRTGDYSPVLQMLNGEGQ